MRENADNKGCNVTTPLNGRISSIARQHSCPLTGPIRFDRCNTASFFGCRKNSAPCPVLHRVQRRRLQKTPSFPWAGAKPISVCHRFCHRRPHSVTRIPLPSAQPPPPLSSSSTTISRFSSRSNGKARHFIFHGGSGGTVTLLLTRSKRANGVQPRRSFLSLGFLKGTSDTTNYPL